MYTLDVAASHSSTCVRRKGYRKRTLKDALVTFSQFHVSTPARSCLTCRPRATETEDLVAPAPGTRPTMDELVETANVVTVVGRVDTAAPPVEAEVVQAVVSVDVVQEADAVDAVGKAVARVVPAADQAARGKAVGKVGKEGKEGKAAVVQAADTVDAVGKTVARMVGVAARGVTVGKVVERVVGVAARGVTADTAVRATIDRSA